MMLGMTLLAVNVRYVIEVFLTYLFLFWEQKSMLLLLKQNFVAHKRSNKLTSVIFAMSIGVVIFARVATQIVLDSSSY